MELRRPTKGAPEEVEIKLHCADLSAAREKLRAAGAEQVSEAHAESNDLYDDPDSTLRGRGCTLRLRRAGTQAILTFKGPARFENGVRRRRARWSKTSGRRWWRCSTDSTRRGTNGRQGITWPRPGSASCRRSAGGSISSAA